MQKIRDFKVDFFTIFGGNAPRLHNGEGYGWPSQTPPIGASRLPRLARDLRTTHLPYLEIKLTFECTAWFYGLAPPLSTWISVPLCVLCHQYYFFKVYMLFSCWERAVHALCLCGVRIALKDAVKSSSSKQVHTNAAAALWILENEEEQEDAPLPTEHGLYYILLFTTRVEITANKI